MIIQQFPIRKHANVTGLYRQKDSQTRKKEKYCFATSKIVISVGKVLSNVDYEIK